MQTFHSNILPLHGAAESLQGGRFENQDDYCFLDTPLGFLFIVCDGMGGGPGGKTASATVKTAISEHISGCSTGTSRAEALRQAAEMAQEALQEKIKHNPQLNGMGSTFVAVLVNGKSAVIAHTGDSRCYRLRGGKLLFRTRDHSLVEELVQRKTLTEEQARISPQSNIITRALGCGKSHTPDVEEQPYKAGDRFILCTDGVWGIMPQTELLERLSSDADEGLVVSRLSKEIDEMGDAQGGNHDNHTLGIICMESKSTLKEKSKGGKRALVSVIVLALIIAAAILGYNAYRDHARDTFSNSPLVNNESAEKPLPQDPDMTAAGEANGDDGQNAEEGDRDGSLVSAAEPQVIAADIIGCLDAWAEYSGDDKSEALKTTQGYLNKVKSSLKGLNVLVTDEQKDAIKDISEFVETNAKVMSQVGMYDSHGMYQPTTKAQALIGKVKAKLENVKDQL